MMTRSRVRKLTIKMVSDVLRRLWVLSLGVVVDLHLRQPSETRHRIERRTSWSWWASLMTAIGLLTIAAFADLPRWPRLDLLGVAVLMAVNCRMIASFLRAARIMGTRRDSGASR
jgi:hypothetical protein